MRDKERGIRYEERGIRYEGNKGSSTELEFGMTRLFSTDSEINSEMTPIFFCG